MNKRAYFKHLYKQFKPFLILSFALAMAEPLITLSGGFGLWSNYLSSASNFPAFIYDHSYLAILTIGLGFLVPLVLFHYLYRPADLDTYYSMPASKKELFFSHFLFGWLMLVAIPIFLSLLVQFFVKARIFQTATGSRFFFSWECISTYLLDALVLLAGSLIAFLPSTLSVLCTTTLFNGIIYGIAFELIPTGLQNIILLIREHTVGYLSGSYYDYRLNFISFKSTFFPLLRGISSPGEKAAYLLALAVWFLLAVGLTFLCYRLFEKRQVEKVNTNEMFRGFYPAMILITGTLIISILLGNSLFRYNLNLNGLSSFFWASGLWREMIPIFIFCLVVFLVVQISRYNGHPPIVRSLAAYLLIFCLGFLLSSSLWGPVRRTFSLSTPRPEKIDRVIVLNPIKETVGLISLPKELEAAIQPEKEELPGPANTFPAEWEPFNMPPAGSLPDDQKGPYLTFTDQEDIKKLMKWQKEYVRKMYNWHKLTAEEKEASYKQSTEGETQPSPSSLENGSPSPHDWDSHSTKVAVQILCLDKKGRLLDSRELRLWMDPDIQKWDELFKGKLLMVNGQPWKNGAILSPAEDSPNKE